MHVDDEIVNKNVGWRGKILSSGGSLADPFYLKSYLTSITICLLSVIKFPKWAVEVILTRSGKCHLANWQLMIAKKKMWMVVPDLQHINMCLLASWIFIRHHLCEDVIWRKVVDSKCRTKKPNLFCCPDEQYTSPFWRVMWASKAAQMGYSWKSENS